jgi:hypothetical protein
MVTCLVIGLLFGIVAVDIFPPQKSSNSSSNTTFNLRSLNDSYSFGSYAFSVPAREGYPFCFGMDLSGCYFNTPSTSPGYVNGMTISLASAYASGPAFLLINYNATQDTSIRISQDDTYIVTKPSLNSSFSGYYTGYNAQYTKPDYDFLIPVDPALPFSCFFLDNSTLPDQVTMFMSLVW